MPESAPRRRWSLGGYRSGVLMVTGWMAVWLFPKLTHALRLDDVIGRVFSGFPALEEYARHLRWFLEESTSVTLLVTALAATMFVPLGFVVRLVARARLRAGQGDLLDRARTWASRHPLGAAVSVAVLPILWQAWLLAGHPFYWWLAFVQTLHFSGSLVGWPAQVAAAAVFGFAQVRIARAWTHDLLAPTMPSKTSEPLALEVDEILFSAVAVTRETKAAIAALAALTLGVIAFIATRPIGELFRDQRLIAVIVSYVGVAAASAFAFRRASRISVGVDGVYVGGTSRPRFYAYRNMDAVRVRNGDIELVKNERVVLRLQLHGEDATRREAIVARIEAGLAQAREVERDAAAHFVTSRSREKVSNAVEGKLDYRMPSVSPDALWSLVEGSGVDAATRTAAAEALAHSGGTVDRGRFRVAAIHCADPKVRVVLEELGSEDGEEAAASGGAAGGRRGLRPLIDS
jgi:hypothetical protein